MKQPRLTPVSKEKSRKKWKSSNLLLKHLVSSVQCSDGLFKSKVKFLMS